MLSDLQNIVVKELSTELASRCSMNASDCFEQLMVEVRRGTPEAVEELIGCYGRAVLFAVRRHLGSDLRVHYDSEDIAQSVWASFFRLPAHRGEFHSPRALIAYLSQMARNRVAMKANAQFAQKRSAPGQRSLDSSLLHEQVCGNSPTPSELVVAQEIKEKLEAKLPSQHQAILQLRLEGNSRVEIAQQLGVNERTVRRILQALSTRYSKQ